MNKALMDGLNQNLNTLLALSKNEDIVENFTNLFKEVLKNKDLDPDIFMVKLKK